jgi:hypothetical protein
MTGTVYSFRKRLMEDIEKIQTRSPGWTNTCGAWVFAVGVTGSDGDLCGYEAVLKPGYMRVQYTKTPSRFLWHGGTKTFQGSVNAVHLYH